MAVLDDIYAAASVFADDTGDEKRAAVLMRLCSAARTTLELQLRDGITVDDCYDSFVCAAAWLALSALGAGDEAGGVVSLRAGEISLQKGGSGAAACLRNQAMLLMAPYCRPGGFAFRGVRG